MADPLRKNTTGTVYERPPEVERQIDELIALADEGRSRRFLITDQKDSDYVRSECLLYFLRRARADNSLKDFERIFKLLIRRVRQALPGGWRRENGPVVAAEEQAASSAEARFLEMLAQDYNGYESRLDFFEVKFAKAVQALRRTALSKIYKGRAREATLPEDADAVEKLLTSEPGFNPLDSGRYSDPLYRIRLRDAIDSLPDDQRQALILDWVGVPFTTNDPDMRTVGSYIGCKEQAARQKRDRAQEAVRRALEGDGDD